MRRRIELHHVAGRNNSDLTAPLCVKCHNEITKCQCVWDIRWTRQDNPQQLKDAYTMQGVRELLLLKFARTQDETYYHLANSLSYSIGQLLVSI